MSVQTRAFSLVAIGAILGLFWGGACGGGGGGGAAAAPPQATGANGRIHRSAVGGVVAVPDASVVTIREVVFTPTGPTDFLHEVVVEGLYTTAVAGNGVMIVTLLDENDAMLAVVSVPFESGVGAPYRNRLAPFVGTTPGDATAALVYPSTSYKVRFEAGTSTYNGQIDSTRFSFFTTENVQVESPSSRIAG